jgi:cyanophycinase-like exopeptidase
MTEVDQLLLTGRPPRAVYLPTAAGQETDERVDYWLELGRSHFEGIGVEAVGLRVLTREDADDPAFAEQIGEAGLIYLSGGSPGYLADTLRDTLVWRAILEAFQSGAALAGCSAGACALSAVAGAFRRPTTFSGVGLSVIPQLSVIPHFDRFDVRSPGLAEEFVANAPRNTTVIGIDEETALVGGPEDFSVMGQQSAWWIAANGERLELPSGTHVRLREGEVPVVLDDAPTR